jgi:hypothetical protein
MENCYDCGKPLTKDNTTKEHIPAKNLFNGYPPEYKNNRLTVPACFDCNQAYSKIDQEIRDAIGIMNDKEPHQQELTRQAVKSILRRNNWKERVEQNEKGDVASVSFSYEELRQLHIKNFKGIFYSIYGLSVPENFEIEIISDGDEEFEHLVTAAQVMHDYIDSFKDWKQSGHQDVFMYNMKTMSSDAEGKICDNGDVGNSMAIVSVLIYHKKLSAVVVAAKKDFLESVKSKHK